MNIEVVRKLVELVDEWSKLSASECTSVVGNRTVVFNYGREPTRKRTLRKMKKLSFEIDELRKELFNGR